MSMYTGTGTLYCSCVIPWPMKQYHVVGKPQNTAAIA